MGFRRQGSISLYSLNSYQDAEGHAEGLRWVVVVDAADAVAGEYDRK